jgi:hypothetical protein
VSRSPFLIFAAGLALALSACSGEKLSPEAERGRHD